MNMNAQRSGLSVLLPTVGMEICRLYAVFSLLFLIPGCPPYPFGALACVLTAGMLLGRGLSFVSIRRITTIVVYGLSCALSVFLLVLPYSGYVLWLIACTAAIFFSRGVFLGRKGVSRSLTVSRYDIGVGIFFFMYFLRLGLHETDPLSLRIAGAYFLFSILALSTSLSWERDENFTVSRSAVSHVIPFIAVFFLTSAAVVLLFPLLTRTATSVYIFLSDHSGPVVNFLIAFIRFFFRYGRSVRVDASSSMESGNSEDYVPIESSEPSIFVKIFLGMITVFGVVMIIITLVILVRALVRYLLVRKGPQGSDGLFSGIKRLLRFLQDRLSAVLHVLSSRHLLHYRYHGGIAEEAFRRLCRWGRVSGIPRKICETPAEYAYRLGVLFPAVGEAAVVLAGRLEEELYGGRPAVDPIRSQLKASLRSFSNPALIPARISCRLRLRGHSM